MPCNYHRNINNNNNIFKIRCKIKNKITMDPIKKTKFKRILINNKLREDKKYLII